MFALPGSYKPTHFSGWVVDTPWGSKPGISRLASLFRVSWISSFVFAR